MTPGSDEYNTIHAESVDLQNSFFIISHYKSLSDLNPPKTNRVGSIYHTHLYFIVFKNYLFWNEVCLFVEYYPSYLQNQRPMHHIFYFCLLGRTYVDFEPLLSLCLCPIWDYQGLSTLETISYQSTLPRAVLYFK